MPEKGEIRIFIKFSRERECEKNDDTKTKYTSVFWNTSARNERERKERGGDETCVNSKRELP